MAALKPTLSPNAPTDVPPALYRSFNDIHLAIFNLVNALNQGKVFMMSPNGHYWLASISNTGTVTWTDVGPTAP